MRIAVISNCGAEDAYLIARVATRFDVVGILRPGAKSRAAARTIPTLQSLPAAAWKRAKGIARRAWYDAYYSRVGERLERALTPPPLPVPPHDVARDRFHDPETIERVRAWAPDVLILSGAPMLKPALYRHARITLNVHFGLAPDYRGEHTIFMPLLRGDYARIGATLHRVDEGVDTGPVLVRVYPELEPGDDEAAVFAKLTRQLGDALVGVLEDFDAGRVDETSGELPAVTPSHVPTPIGGFNVRYRDRGLRHDVAFHVRRALGRTPAPYTEERVEHFY